MTNLATQLRPYWQLTRMNRPIGILLLLWPTLTALWIAAGGLPDIKILLIFIAGVVLMRAAGCAINDFADRHIDGQVWRTENRPLATGALSAKQAVLTFVVLALFAFMLVLLLNPFTIALSLVAVLLAAVYPFMKRFTYLPQLVLGMAFGWAIPMAFAAQTNALPAIVWWLFVANIIWTTMYDTFYAMADREDDLQAGVKSTAILFGQKDLLIQGMLQIGYLLILLFIGLQLQFGMLFYIGLAIAAVLFVYQLWLSKDRERHACLKAFLNNNWVGAVIFISIVLHYSLS
ncbi:MAG TPA: 4-hydroxybenzoate octaprenyltransferase [Methylophaga sp.]|jgi:4-hydroxybenzoate polyprenyltransferase|uniref:4-hydroxybenzoate octaprenyltransferase n=1 Tax=Pseudidiomarina aestuarii TaxID=624146 RepID=A0A2T4CZM5_9GAMM|nr:MULTISPECIES: 4-hydroxybenzoate octaprenyltransferase [unclassified Methylophaga]PTB86928.1 4-hydroxybenzoate octaprenyltransferase [Pseudidiomarina aestuarii]MAP26343.1 4-hydroxybenzoate octaprenyltransferase [Methylophaga sp.]HAD30089.1 4-hydroxybenzoate octaprenyltransferase [Methylophaga sp.]HBX60098.1 4-hydroxybenzoate octaprenyltransferase [Methylophaga sp.]HCO00294.1 4-hydroxybenzoate octaprenyltransferase [Methylophaga sp.]|tara:strand:+ start:1984 stop:2850 length:867 start_codon:yes stop_codon:yes gene_type:complete